MKKEHLDFFIEFTKQQIGGIYKQLEQIEDDLTYLKQELHEIKQKKP